MKIKARFEGGGIIFIWKHLVTDLVSVMIIIGSIAPHEI